ncbi:MAG: TolC family protein, partial [Candidatus Moranbacteria bacterium]|nr:TolC family protein [Candidatus Moranbacteria bacterium]
MKFISILFFILVLCVSLVMADENLQATGGVPEVKSDGKILKYDMTLWEASRLALRNNFDIQLAKYDILIAATGETQARSLYDTILRAEIGYRNNQLAQASALSPAKAINNSYDLGITKTFPTGTTFDLDLINDRDAVDSPFTESLVHDSLAQVTIVQDLGKNFFGLADRGRVRLALLDIESVEFTSLEKIQDSLGDVQSSYWKLVQFKKALEVQKEILELAKKLWEFNQERFEDKRIESGDLFASEANYFQQLSQALVAQDTYDQAHNRLKLSLNIAEDAVQLNPTDSLFLPDSDEEAGLSLQNAFRYRPDYQRQKKVLDIRKLQLEINKNLIWPEINVKASFARNGLGDHFHQAQQRIIDQDNPEWYVGFEVSIPLENSQARSDVEESRLQDAKSILQLKYLE